MSHLGFGSIEIGTVTPKPQEGNPKPRLFRLAKDEALINRMGFNNKGADVVLENLKKRKNKHIIVGVNIGKNKITPNEKAVYDYLYCFETLFEEADYFTVNVSSPNTPGLRELQSKDSLKALLESLMSANVKKISPKPIYLKIAPDLTNEMLDDIIHLVETTGIHGINCTNTTTSRSNLITSKTTIDNIGNGGLSGKPLRDRSREILDYIVNNRTKIFTIFSVGGINSSDEANTRVMAKADIVQLYSGMIFEGPALVTRIKKGLND